MDRYFLVSYVAEKADGALTMGNIHFAMDGYPPGVFIKDAITHLNEAKIFRSIAVLNILEFANKEDYEDYRSDEY